MYKKMKLVTTLVIIFSLSACTSTSSNIGGEKKGGRLTFENLPQISKINYQMGVEYVQNGSYDSAEEKLLKVVANSPKFPDAYNALGVLQEQRGKLSEAATLFAKAISLDPYYSVAMTNYSRLQCADGSNSRLAQIAGQAQGTVKAGMYAGAAECALKAGDNAGALASAQQAINADPRYASSFLLQATALHRSGNSAQALQSLDQYHDLSGYSEVSTRLGLQIAEKLRSKSEIDKYTNILQTQFRR